MHRAVSVLLNFIGFPLRCGPCLLQGKTRACRWAYARVLFGMDVIGRSQRAHDSHQLETHTERACSDELVLRSMR